MVLEVRGLDVRRGTFTLSVPTLDIAPGTVVGLCGRNGAGKSTLLECLAGLLPAAGEIRILGMHPIRDLVALRRRTAWMSDDMPLFPVSLREHARLLARFYPRWDMPHFDRVVERLQLDPGKRVTDLSKGEGTRARLALCLGHHPEVLLLDEPATGLDVPARRALLAELLELMQDENRVILLSSHQVEDVARICDRVLVIDGGRIVRDGTLDEVTGGTRTLAEVLA